MDLSALCVYTRHYFMYIGILITFLFRRGAVTNYFVTADKILSELVEHGK